MSKIAGIILGIIGLVVGISGCNRETEPNTLKFATCADYPPFEYLVNGELQGFDIDLARLIAKELGMDVQFEDMQFSTILPVLQNGHVDAAISTITVTPERAAHFGISDVYYFAEITAVFKKSQPIVNKADLAGKKISCLLGSTMELWLKNNGFDSHMISMENNNQAVEALKANHVQVVIMDKIQAQSYCKANSDLSYQLVEQAKDGYGIITKINNPLLPKINQALKQLHDKGDIAKLEKKWIDNE